MAVTIKVPNDWQPRPYQLPLWRALESGVKRAAVVWHRRSGKDSLSLNWTACAAFRRRGVYWHMLPTQKQARKVVWDNVDGQARRIIDQVFPSPLRKSVNTTDLKIELINGSIWQLCGSDNYDSLVGSNPVGVVFSEWSLTNPAAWDYVRPILLENGGWALFIYTPRGRNHGWEMYDMALHNPDWFAQKLTIEDTGVVTLDAIEKEKRDGMSEEMVNQEFYCSFESPMFGALLAKYLDEEHVINLPYDPKYKVNTYWDLGVGDATAVWFVQQIKGEIRIIDYLECNGEGLPYYAAELQKKRYVYGEHWAPHDIKVKEFGTGRTRVETAASLGIRFRVVPMASVEDGIEAARQVLPQCWFDREKCASGLSALRQYHKTFDDNRRIFIDKPCHDWSSHGADAFRYFALVSKTESLERKLRPAGTRHAKTEYNRYGRYTD